LNLFYIYLYLNKN